MKGKTGIKLTDLPTWNSEEPHGLTGSDWISTGYISYYEGIEYAEFTNGQGGIQDWPTTGIINNRSKS